ncbi:MAG: heme ABC transporter ATP-binding protein [Roseobacter sp.]
MSLQVSDLSVSYAKKPVLERLGFVAQSATLTAIVGPNGSGKSTLIKAICGDTPYRGSVRLNGVEICNAEPWELAATRAVLPQASNLAFPFQVIEVVRIGLMSGENAEQQDRAEAALTRVGLSGYAHRLYQELSGGEQQRVQLARVLAQVWKPVQGSVPHWLFLDEPVSSLDVAHQLQVMELAREFARAGGGVVAVMHDLNLTGLYADEILVMSKGRIIAQGKPENVMTDHVLSTAYGCSLRVNAPPPRGEPFILPHSASSQHHKTPTT